MQLPAVSVILSLSLFPGVMAAGRSTAAVVVHSDDVANSQYEAAWDLE